MAPSKKNSSPVKNAAAVKAAASPGRQKGSPLPGRKAKGSLKPMKLPPGWYIRSVLLQGLLEVIMVTTSSMVDDGYTHTLWRTLNDPDAPDDIPVKSIGLLNSFGMRISLARDEPLTNSKNSFQRKAFVRILDPGEDTPESRLAALRVIQEFLQQRDNNRYGTAVRIQEPGWDLTPPGDELPKLDHYIEYREMKVIVDCLFEEVGGNWAASNMDAALSLFTPGYIPFAAAADLGFPLSMVQTGPSVLPGIGSAYTNEDDHRDQNRGGVTTRASSSTRGGDLVDSDDASE